MQVLSKLFKKLRRYKLRLNPAKCLFGVKSWKLLEFIVREKINKIYLEKIKDT
jgi:hypothetical protein